MSEQNQEKNQRVNWKTQTYFLGAIVGAVMGFLSAYLFAKEVEDSADNKEEAPEVPAITLLGLALSVMTLVRKIAETGRKKDGRR